MISSGYDREKVLGAMTKFKLNEQREVVPCSVGEWMLSFEDMRYGRVVAQHFVLGPPGQPHNGVAVSTVFLGIDYSWGSAPEPLVFETMVFTRGIGRGGVLTTRASTWTNALSTHVIVVANVFQTLRALGLGGKTGGRTKRAARYALFEIALRDDTVLCELDDDL